MSAGLLRYNGDIYDDNSDLTLSVNISTQEFYEKYWEKARKELGIKYTQDGAEFNKSKLNDVLVELDLLMNWAINNLTGTELEYMKERIENLQKVIPDAFIDDNTVIYILKFELAFYIKRWLVSILYITLPLFLIRKEK